MDSSIVEIAQICLNAGQLAPEQIEVLLGADYYDLLYWANRIRERFFGNQIGICSIVAGRLGGCDQDCKFCAQSARYNGGYIETKITSDETILDVARQARDSGVRRFGIVYSGRGVSEKELGRLEGLIKQIHDLKLEVCGSFGIITVEQAQRLVRSGLTGYNHNLETSKGHFSEIVSTHDYADRVRTIEAAKEAGLGVCAGGIFGIGESDKDRVDMARELRRLGVDTVPMNFLHPIEGTPLADSKRLEPREILRIIALYRFILPSVNLKVAGGRVLNLGDMQSWIFYAGANAVLSGNYLTTSGRSVKEDMRMLDALGLEAK